MKMMQKTNLIKLAIDMILKSNNSLGGQIQPYL